MNIYTPIQNKRITPLKGLKNGFTLMELTIIIAIIATTTTWAMPKFTRTIEQKRVDNYTQNLQAGLFNLKNRIQKSSKKCTLFKGFWVN